MSTLEVERRADRCRRADHRSSLGSAGRDSKFLRIGLASTRYPLPTKPTRQRGPFTYPQDRPQIVDVPALGAESSHRGPFKPFPRRLWASAIIEALRLREVRGVPLRLELGERELDDGQATLVRRDTGAKERASTEGVASQARELLAEIQRRLLADARAFRAEHTLENPTSYAIMREFLEAAGGLAIAPWCGSPTCEERVKREARATIRCLPLEQVRIKGECIVCEAPAVEHATWSQAY